MKLYKCKCGGSANPPFMAGVCEDSYKDLYVCIDCNKKYIKLDNKLKLLSNAEFWQLIRQREEI